MNENMTQRERAPVGVVVVERGTPDPRRVLGRLLERSRTFDLAVSGIRLASLVFRPRDIAATERCRVLIGGFDNHALLDAAFAAAAVPEHATNLRVLRDILASGRVEIRSAGVWRWNPDFCVAEGDRLRAWFPSGSAGLVGYMGLGAAPLYVAPRLACLVSGHRSMMSLRGRFDELWNVGHDVRDVVVEALRVLGPDAAA
jgi:hypothetical protein